MTRARTQYTEIRCKGFNALDQIENVMPLDTGFQAQLLEVLADDEDEAVVGIDQENFHSAISSPVTAR
ncbi:hypothetical protein D3C81_2253400 [compost metagenome]